MTAEQQSSRKLSYAAIPIAIIGMACRVPKANSPQEFWENLVQGRDCLTFLNDHPTSTNERGLDGHLVPRGGFLERDVAAFDAALFGYTPLEAAQIDPQQRHFMECTWEALEDGGYDPARYTESIGLYAGCLLNSYLLQNPNPYAYLNDPTQGFLNLISSDKDSLATRVAFKLNLRGPAMTVQTYCSTSLVAVHLAIQALRAGECRMALAGAAAIRVPHRSGYYFRPGGIQSPDGYCRPFDKSANGTVLSNGVGVILLKALDRALADGDDIYAVIRGSALNNDGNVKAGFTAPSATGQAKVVSLALENAGIPAQHLSYIEAHGTGTVLGDPIEIEGLARALPPRSDGQRYKIGAVKGNIGHLDCAAGVIGVIKTALALKTRKIPATINFVEPNPHLRLEERPFLIVSQLTDWPSEQSGAPRCAGVSSFGIGGTNAHVILEEAPSAERQVRSRRDSHLILLSAKNDSALERLKHGMLRYLPSLEPQRIADFAFTTQVGRKALSMRRYALARTVEEATRALEMRGGLSSLHQVSRRTPFIVFAFPGHGSQFPGMARLLVELEPAFQRPFNEVADVLREFHRVDLRRLIMESDPLEGVLDAQAAIFAVQYSLAKMLESWGVRPSAFLGYSLGELTAAVCADIMSLSDALRLLVVRARMVEECSPGHMVAVPLGRPDVDDLVGDGVELAAENSPRQSVLTGSVEAIGRLELRLQARGITSLRVPANRAFHHSSLRRRCGALSEQLAGMVLRKGRTPLLAATTGTWLTDAQATDPAYWINSLCAPVNLLQGIKLLLKNSSSFFVEVGTGAILNACLKQTANPQTVEVWSCLPQNSHYSDSLYPLLAELWLRGVNVDWNTFQFESNVRRIHFSTYPFANDRHWISKTQFENVQASGPIAIPHHQLVPPLQQAELERVDSATLMELVRSQLSAMIGIEISQSRMNESFNELGLDSLLLTQLIQVIKKQFGVSIAFHSLQEEMRSPAAMVSYLETCKLKVPTAPISVDPSISTSSQILGPNAHGPFKAVSTSRGTRLSPEQLSYLTALTDRYTRRTKQSKKLAAEHRKHLCDPRSLGGFNRVWKEMVYPIICERSRGAYLWDIDGNQYIDIVMGFGANYLGHSPEFVTQAVAEQLERGYEIGPQSPLAGKVAERICALTGMDRAIFCNTGSEAIIAAMRVARAVSGRDKMVMFSGAYHGIFDSVLTCGSSLNGKPAPVAMGIPSSAVADTIVLPFLEQAALNYLEQNAASIAGVLVEPVQARHMERESSAFLHKLRSVTAALDIPLIFDEMITGFRCALGGAQEYFGVKADLAAYGKVLGGGLPIGVLAGSARYMRVLDGGEWSYADDSVPDGNITFFAGTFVRHPLALAACCAVLSFLEANGGSLQKRINERVTQFSNELSAFFSSQGIPISLTHFSSLFNLSFSSTAEYAGALYYRLREEGIYAWEGRLGHFSISHQEEDFAQITEAIKRCTLEKQQKGFF